MGLGEYLDMEGINMEGLKAKPDYPLIKPNIFVRMYHTLVKWPIIYLQIAIQRNRS